MKRNSLDSGDYSRPVLFILLAALLASGCSTRKDGPQVEEAYVARDGVKLRAELRPDAPIVATLTLGERVGVVEHKQRYVLSLIHI